MGQMIIMDEDDVEIMRASALAYNQLAQRIDLIGGNLYPDKFAHYWRQPSTYTAVNDILTEMRNEIEYLRKPWWLRMFKL